MSPLGFNLSTKFYGMILRKFDRDGTREISFDDFIQCLVIIQVPVYVPCFFLYNSQP